MGDGIDAAAGTTAADLGVASAVAGVGISTGVVKTGVWSTGDGCTPGVSPNAGDGTAGEGTAGEGIAGEGIAGEGMAGDGTAPALSELERAGERPRIAGRGDALEDRRFEGIEGERTGSGGARRTALYARLVVCLCPGLLRTRNRRRGTANRPTLPEPCDPVWDNRSDIG